MNLSALYHHCVKFPVYHSSWLDLSSTVFSHGGVIPALYRSDGLNVNPSLQISSLPSLTKSMAVFLLDTDAPISARLHWICWDIPPSTQIQVNEQRGVTGMNDFQLTQYVGPCLADRAHKYLFIVFALDAYLYAPLTTSKFQIERMMQPHLLAWGTILFFSPRINIPY